MTTPAALGLDTPTPNDLIREGANNITTNAQVLAQLHDQLLDQIAATINHVPALADGTDLNTLTSTTTGGPWRATGSQVINGPSNVVSAGLVFSYRTSSTRGWQDWIVPGTGNTFRRTQNNGTWSPWSRIDRNAIVGNVTLSNVNLDDLTEQGTWWAAASNGVTGYPPNLSGALALVQSFVAFGSNSLRVQRWLTYGGSIYQRTRWSGGWRPWTQVLDGQNPTVPIFHTRSAAETWESNNPGQSALYLG